MGHRFLILSSESHLYMYANCVHIIVLKISVFELGTFGSRESLYLSRK